MKRILTILLTVIMLGSLSVNCVTADETKDITVTLDGNQMNFPMQNRISSKRERLFLYDLSVKQWELMCRGTVKKAK